MDTANHKKNERINLRLKSSAKSLIERAAVFEGKTVSSFIIISALERAEKTVQEHELIRLNAENSITFFNALTAPIKFNQNLITALEDHDTSVTSK